MSDCLKLGHFIQRDINKHLFTILFEVFNNVLQDRPGTCHWPRGGQSPGIRSCLDDICSASL